MVAIYLDGADLATMRELAPQVSGYTTNPSLMAKAGISDYRAFADLVLTAAQGKPVSFEVLADDEDSIYRQAREISKWGENVFVKVPVMRTSGEDNYHVIRNLSRERVKLNVTAVFTLDQIKAVARNLTHAPAIISIFCGRIADTGRDPMPFVTDALRVKAADTKILWASTRELLNVKQAEQAGADIITMTPDLIRKMHLFGRDLSQYSLETVKQFFNDAKGIQL